LGRFLIEGEMSTSANDQHTDLIDSVQQLLETLSIAPIEEKYCEHCGSSLSYLGAHFWLAGCDKGWDLRLPYCANCHPELSKRQDVKTETPAIIPRPANLARPRI
jgi:hypothetical protein